MTTYSVSELQRAVKALDAGRFRKDRVTDRPHVQTSTERWDPTGLVLTVVGASGRVGATTVALALAEAAGLPARVLETGPMHRTGLATATSAELGVNDEGWRRGTRGEVLIERTSSSYARPDEVPTPTPDARQLTVVDVGWDLAQVTSGRSWLRDLITSGPLLIVTAATAPGLRALDTALHLCGRNYAGVSALVLGPPRKRWPAVASTALASKALELDRAGRVRVLPLDRRLAAGGITGDPLPAHLVRAVQPIVSGLAGVDLERNHS